MRVHSVAKGYLATFVTKKEKKRKNVIAYYTTGVLTTRVWSPEVM